MDNSQDYAMQKGLIGDVERVRMSCLRRFSPLSGIGQDLRGANSFNEALTVSGLGFTPLQKTLQTSEGKPITGFKAIFNDDKQLSVVKDEYTVVTNEEAFAIAEDLVEFEGFKYEVSNLVNNGARSRLVLSGGTVMIQGEEFTPYAIFNNSFDVSKSVSVQFMFLRLVCLNGLMRKSPDFNSSVAFTHFGAKEPKLKKLTLFQTQFAKTISYLRNEAEVLQNTKLTRKEFADEIIPLVVSHTFQRPTGSLITERQQTRTIAFVESILSAYDSVDTQNFNGTAYKAFLAMSDMDSHVAPFVNHNNSDLYINRVLQDGVRTSLVNLVGDYLIKSRHLLINI